MLASAWKNSLNATIVGVRVLLSSRALKSLNSVKKSEQERRLQYLNANPLQQSSHATAPLMSTKKQTSPPSIMSYLSLSDTFPNTDFDHRLIHE